MDSIECSPVIAILIMAVVLLVIASLSGTFFAIEHPRAA